MANSVSHEIEETGDIDALLAQLPFEMRQRILPKAQRASVKVIQKAARAKLPNPGYPGDKDPAVSLKRNIVIRVKTYENHVVAIVGPTFNTPHSHLVEFGHRLVKSIKSIDGVQKVQIGFVAAKPYMRPAIDETVNEQHTVMIARIEKEIEKFHEKFAAA